MSSVVIQGDTSGSVTIQAPTVSGTTIINLPTVTGGSFIVGDSSGNVGIGYTSTTAGAAANNFVVAGNVGIGTNAPTAKFHVVQAGDAVRFESASNGAVNTYWKNSTQQYSLRLDTDNNGTRDFSFYDVTNNHLFDRYYQGASGYRAFYTVGTEKMRINSAGKVGIGTTAPDLLLTVAANTSGNNLTSVSDYRTLGGVHLSDIYNTANYGPTLLFDHGTLGAGISSSRVATNTWGTDLRFFTHPDATSAQYALSERMRIDQAGNVMIGYTSTTSSSANSFLVAGNVGIGTNAPVSKLNVAGTFTITAAGMQLDNNQAVSGKNTSGTSRQMLVIDASNNLIVGGTVDGGTIFNTNLGNERMRVDAPGNVMIGYTSTTSQANSSLLVAGNVGIGTNAPGSKLTVAGSVSFASGQFTSDTNGSLFTQGNTLSTNVPNGAVGINSSPSAGRGLYLTNKAGNTAYDSLYVVGIASQTSIIRTLDSAGTTLFKVEGGGSVGIGTDSPGAKLQVAGSVLSLGYNVTTGGGINSANSGTIDTDGAGTLRHYSRGANASTVGSHSFRLASSDGSIDTLAMQITTAGNVGVGTNNPQAALHVYSGDIMVGNAGNVLSRMFRAVEVGSSGNNAGITFGGNGSKGSIFGQSGTGGLWIIGSSNGGSQPLNFGYSANDTSFSANTVSLGAWGTTGFFVGGTTFSTNNGFVDKILNVYGANNAVFGGVSSNTSFGTCFEASRTGRTGATRFAQISMATDASDNGVQIFYTAPSGSGVTERMRIDSVGNVGIGNNAPATRLYVSGSAASNNATLTDGATITPDFTQSNNFSVTLAGNRTMANPTGLTVGQSGVIFITQDATGSRTLAWGTSWDWANAGVPVLTTAANAIDVVAYTVRTATSIVAQIIQNIG